MSTETETATANRTGTNRWLTGVVGGLAGALAMGALVLAMNEPTLAVAIPSMYGLAPPPDPVLGTGVHLFHGAVLGLAFAALAGLAGVESPGRVVGLGLAWGVATWVGLAALVMPVWLSVVASPASPPFPNFAAPSLLWHLVYGLVLGVVVAATDRLL